MVNLSIPHPLSLSSVLWWTGQGPAAGGAPDGLPHHESPGGRRVGGVEHRRLHLRLHQHQRHGAAHPHPGEGHHRTPVCHRAALSRGPDALHLHPSEETLTRLAREEGRRHP